jgi:hypothetical protein
MAAGRVGYVTSALASAMLATNVQSVKEEVSDGILLRSRWADRYEEMILYLYVQILILHSCNRMSDGTQQAEFTTQITVTPFSHNIEGREKNMFLPLLKKVTKLDPKIIKSR